MEFTLNEKVIYHDGTIYDNKSIETIIRITPKG